jgi:NADH:ubiquinone reductase (H+-translocating)
VPGNNICPKFSKNIENYVNLCHQTKKMKLIILGGGFGGLRLARKLNNNPAFDITLIDRFNYHQFQPLFYQVATAGLDASNISFPLRKVFQKSKNIRFRMAEVEAIDTSSKFVKTSEGNYEYDVLVIAMGATTNFFNNANLEKYAFPMKSTVEALQLRHQLIHNFEDALHATGEEELQRLMNVVVVGGGPTGVELSGAIAVLPKDYPELDFSKMNIYLLEGTGKTLGSMSEDSSKQSAYYLKRLGVTVLTETLMSDYDGKTVYLKDGKQIPSSLVIWAAGIKGNIPAGIDTSLIARGNRLKVDKYNRVEGLNDVFAIGDIAYMEERNYKGHPQVAPVAMQQADLLAKNLKTILKGSDDLKSFAYYDKGAMATVGRNLAVVDVPIPIAIGTKLHFGGFFAWLVWMGLHLMLILGVKNRFFVFINWLYNYVTYDQNLRLIFREFYKDEKQPS